MLRKISENLLILVLSIFLFTVVYKMVLDFTDKIKFLNEKKRLVLEFSKFLNFLDFSNGNFKFESDISFYLGEKHFYYDRLSKSLICDDVEKNKRKEFLSGFIDGMELKRNKMSMILMCRGKLVTVEVILK